MALQINMARALVLPRIRANIGIAALCNIAARKMTARGATKNMASKTRQSNLKLDVTCSSKRPNQGAIKNQPIKSGKNVVPIRAIKEMEVSPWVAKPIKVRMAIVSMSPIISIVFFAGILYSLRPFVTMRIGVPRNPYSLRI